jgi:hypothetical protein
MSNTFALTIEEESSYFGCTILEQPASWKDFKGSLYYSAKRCVHIKRSLYATFSNGDQTFYVGGENNSSFPIWFPMYDLDAVNRVCGAVKEMCKRNSIDQRLSVRIKL